MGLFRRGRTANLARHRRNGRRSKKLNKAPPQYVSFRIDNGEIQTISFQEYSTSMERNEGGAGSRGSKDVGRIELH